MNHEKVTISDIAKAAGVSITTVSRYINGKQDLIQKDTRERIETVIKMTNYHPNVMAQSLKTNYRIILELLYRIYQRLSVLL